MQRNYRVKALLATDEAYKQLVDEVNTQVKELITKTALPKAQEIYKKLKEFKKEKEQKNSGAQHLLNSELDQFQKTQPSIYYKPLLNFLLHELIGLNDTQMLQTVLDRGADLFFTNEFHQTVLASAVKTNHPAVVEFLLMKFAASKEQHSSRIYSEALSFLVSNKTGLENKFTIAHTIAEHFKKHAGEFYFFEAFLLAIEKQNDDGAMLILKYCNFVSNDVLQKACHTLVAHEQRGINRQVIIFNLCSRYFKEFPSVLTPVVDYYSAAQNIQNHFDLVMCFNLYYQLDYLNQLEIYTRIKTIIHLFLDENQTQHLDHFSDKKQLSPEDLKQTKRLAEANGDKELLKKLTDFEKKPEAKSDAASKGYENNQLLKKPALDWNLGLGTQPIVNPMITRR